MWSGHVHGKRLREQDTDIRELIADAVAQDDLKTLKRLLKRQRNRINEPTPSAGSTPLSTASLHGHRHLVSFLLESGADIHGRNRDGNTPLHVAAFMCRTDIVETLLEHGASVSIRNHRGESVTDVVSGEWTDELGRFYTGIANAVGIEIKLSEIRALRPQLAARFARAADADSE